LGCTVLNREAKVSDVGELEGLESHDEAKLRAAVSKARQIRRHAARLLCAVCLNVSMPEAAYWAVEYEEARRYRDHCELGPYLAAQMVDADEEAIEERCVEIERAHIARLSYIGSCRRAERLHLKTLRRMVKDPRFTVEDIWQYPYLGRQSLWPDPAVFGLV
jgi:hypothetical protein